MNRILVIGGSRGIGAGVALRFLNNGDQVLVTSRSPQVFVESLPSELSYRAGNLQVISQNFEEPNAAREFIKKLERIGFRPNIVIFAIGGPVQHKTLNPDDYRSAMQLNFHAPVDLTLSLLPKLETEPWARIVFIGSLATKSGAAELPYITAKASLISFVKFLSHKIGKNYVNVVPIALSLGPIDVEGKGLNRLGKQDPSGLQIWLEKNRIAAGRLGTIAEVSELVFMLSSEYSAFMHGSNVEIDGGGH